MGLRLAVVAPVYNGVDTLSAFHARLIAALEPAVDEFTVTYVDDASSDRTWELVCGLADGDERVSGIRLAANVGQLRAIFAGIDAVEDGRAVLTIDTDLEDPPEEIPALVAGFAEGHDLVVARRIRPNRRPTRRVASALLKGAAALGGTPVADLGSSFLVVEHRATGAVRRVLDRTRTQLLMPVLVGEARNPSWVEVHSDVGQPSGYRPRALVRIAVDFLRLFTFPRLARASAAAGAVLAGAAVVGRWDRARSSVPWLAAAATALAVVFHGARLTERPTDEPLYVVSDRLRPPGPPRSVGAGA